MKIHRPIVQAIFSALNEIFLEDKYADKVIEKHLKTQKKWGARDRKQFAESIYDIIRWQRKLFYMLGDDEIPQPIKETDSKKLFLAWLYLNDYPLPEGLGLEEVAPKKIKKDFPKWEIKQSIPDVLKDLGEKEFADDFQNIITSLNQKAPVYLRTNTLKATREKLQQALKDEGIETEAFGERLETLKLPVRKNVFITKAFKGGLFEVQDGGSQQIAPFLEVEPGLRVVDACAGAGGKTLHLASLMKNKGKIIALDIHQWKLNELKKRARRNGVDIAETRLIDSTKVIKRLKQSADRLLLDVPCTGLGVLRRNPDTKWKFSLEEHKRLIELQQELLERYSSMVKPGGKMVYATCSFLKSENEDQIRKFLSNHPGEWEMEEEKRVWTHETGFDCFYMVRAARIK